MGRQFIATFLERDIPQLGVRIASEALRRFWQMCAHAHGQVWNASKIGGSLGLSHTTARSYVDLLAHAFVLRVLPPFHGNLKKRLVKAPKVYVRDTGLLHALLQVESFADLLGHPTYGGSWESFVIENVIAQLGSQWRTSFYQTSSGTEIDLILERGRHRFAIECKASSAPSVGKGFFLGLTELCVQAAWVVAPVKQSFPLQKNVMVATLADAIAAIKAKC